MIDFKLNLDKCIKCGKCIQECPIDIIISENSIPVIDKEKADSCLECQHCFAVCPTGAISICGKSPQDSIELKNGLSLRSSEVLLVPHEAHHFNLLDGWDLLPGHNLVDDKIADLALEIVAVVVHFLTH